MRKRDKYTNMTKANLIMEQRHLNESSIVNLNINESYYDDDDYDDYDEFSEAYVSSVSFDEETAEFVKHTKTTPTPQQLEDIFEQVNVKVYSRKKEGFIFVNHLIYGNSNGDEKKEYEIGMEFWNTYIESGRDFKSDSFNLLVDEYAGDIWHELESDLSHKEYNGPDPGDFNYGDRKLGEI